MLFLIFVGLVETSIVLTVLSDTIRSLINGKSSK